MHRSGTSAVTRLIGALGAALPADPNPPAPDNPEGYWEPAGLVALNDRLLFLADSAWLDLHPITLERIERIDPAERLSLRLRMDEALTRSFGTSRCFVVKDPRICGLVPLYRDLLSARGADVRVVLMLRHPAAVAASLSRRNPMSNAYAHLLWARHVIEADRDTRDLPRVVVDYDELLRDWRVAAERIAPLLEPPLAAPREREVALDVAVEARPRVDLRHHQAPAAAEALPLEEFARLYDALLDLRANDTDASRAIVDARAADCLIWREQPDLADALDAEYRVQRLTSPYDTVAPLDPVRERAALAAAFDRLHRARLAEAG